MGAAFSSIWIPTDLRRRIDAGARGTGETPAAYVERAVRELQQREFDDAVGAQTYDEADVAEFRRWERANIGPP
jgi:predicted transcriptional regulator